METSNKAKFGLSTQSVIIIAAAIVAAAVIIVVGITLNQPKDTGPGIGYATEAKVMLDQESLQAAMDAAAENAKKGNIGLMYQNDAYSVDGRNFQCYIVNSPSNEYDMFITIFADADLTDELYLSQLVPPGSGFEKLKLEHALSVGSHTVYVALTQVETDAETGEQTIRNQIVHTMDFHVQANA
jgi:hypothetical protein